MDHDHFLSIVYDRFHAGSAWPRVRHLQLLMRPLNVRLLAAQIGTDAVVCEEMADGVCFLRLEGLARCPRAESDIKTFVAAVRFVAKHAVEQGLTPVTSQAFAENLNLSHKALRRLGAILRYNSLPSSGGSWSPDGSSFSVNPNEEAIFFEEVTTLQEFFEISKRLANDAVATASYRHRRWTDATTEGFPEPPNDSDQEHMRVFISWSGEPSHKLALLLHDWLPLVIQAVQPFVSSENINKGTRWPISLARELEQTGFGVLCIVPDNIDEPWLNFEAGALSKIVEDSRVVPLLFGVEPSALIGHPLGQFQAALFEKDEMLKTLQSINELLGSARLSDPHLKKAFEHSWSKLASDVARVPSTLATSVSTLLQPASDQRATLPEIQQRILGIWAKLDDPDVALEVSQVARALDIKEQQARFHLDELDKNDYLHALYAMGSPPRYKIDHKGREFLVQSGLS